MATLRRLGMVTLTMCLFLVWYSQDYHEELSDLRTYIVVIVMMNWGSMIYVNIAKIANGVQCRKQGLLYKVCGVETTRPIYFLRLTSKLPSSLTSRIKDINTLKTKIRCQTCILSSHNVPPQGDVRLGYQISPHQINIYYSKWKTL